MAGYEMAPEFVARAKRPLEIDAAAGGPVAKGGLAQRFVRDVDLELRAAGDRFHAGHRKAAAIAADRSAKRDGAGLPRTFDGKAAIIRGDDGALRLNESRKHDL